MQLDPRQIAKAMKQLGIAQEEIEVEEAVFKTKEKELVFIRPNVTKVTMSGQDTFQVVGTCQERSRETIKEEDVQMVMEQTKTTKEKAQEALKRTKGDIAKAIMELSA